MTAPVVDARIVERLFAMIQSRRGDDPGQSYTARLFAEGRAKIARKTGEEAIEVIIAALEGGREPLTRESADLIYHLLVLWAQAGVEPEDVWRELARREGTSGLAEKASRGET
jgi:phosphoribosyl-ATP pyrophosphohydrolase